MEALGPKLRRQRRRLGLTLDELAGRTGISKPYLSLIETGRVPNPPSDEKLQRLEQSLGFPAGELIGQAHLQRTPRDVRAMLQRLIADKGSGFRVQGSGKKGSSGLGGVGSGLGGVGSGQSAVGSRKEEKKGEAGAVGVNLDEAYMSGVLQELVDRSAGNVEQVATNAVPVINKVSAGYPRDFTDLSYPARVADDYVGCPDVRDQDAFGARVHGDSMVPKYREGDIVIFSPDATPKNGDDCFVRFADGQTTFKRVFFEMEGETAVIRLQPRNERYRAQLVPSEQISGVYKAVFRYQRVDED